jgi:copper chaperone CopZ
MTELTYRVPDLSCGHCERAVSEQISAVAGVQAVEVDLEAKVVKVRGESLDDASIRAAIDEAGYRPA